MMMATKDKARYTRELELYNRSMPLTSSPTSLNTFHGINDSVAEIRTPPPSSGARVMAGGGTPLEPLRRSHTMTPIGSMNGNAHYGGPRGAPQQANALGLQRAMSCDHIMGVSSPTSTRGPQEGLCLGIPIVLSTPFQQQQQQQRHQQQQQDSMQNVGMAPSPPSATSMDAGIANNNKSKGLYEDASSVARMGTCTSANTQMVESLMSESLATMTDFIRLDMEQDDVKG